MCDWGGGPYQMANYLRPPEAPRRYEPASIAVCGPWVHPHTDLPVGRRLKIVAGRGGLAMCNGEVLDIVRVNQKSYTVDWEGIATFRVTPDEAEVLA